MSVIINPIITNAGLNVFTPMATGIEFTFTHVAVGTGTSAANANATALENEIARFTIAGGGINLDGKSASINALITNHANANPQDYNISEIGFYGLDGNNNTVLFAIHRQNTTIVHKVSGADIALSFVIGLSALPTENMTVTIDTNTSGALALLGQHVTANHPHTQYKRILDNTERLKIATAVEADEAIRKDELDALRLRLIANGIDADLAVTNNATGLDFNDNQFKVAGVWYFDHALNTSTANTAGIITVKKAGNKVYQHEILENGQAANRVFTGVQWLPWVYQTGAIQGVVTFIPIDDYADLNDFNTVGYFTFSTSDNVGHAPPTYGLESDYEMEVLLSGGNLIQIVKNITTNSSFIRARNNIGVWVGATWVLTPPIQHIVTNANLDNIRSEGVYLCTGSQSLYGYPMSYATNDVCILYVKNSNTLQTVVQVIHRIKHDNNSDEIDMQSRSLIDNGNNIFYSWSYTNYNDSITTYFLNGDKFQRLYDYLASIGVTYSHLDAFKTHIHEREGQYHYILRNYNLNNVTQEGIYIFTLNDNIENIPSIFTDENHFCFLLVITDSPKTAQMIFQGHSTEISSEVYIRHQSIDDWQNHVTPPAWVIVP